jgi:hypothetical protein
VVIKCLISTSLKFNQELLRALPREFFLNFTVEDLLLLDVGYS